MSAFSRVDSDYWEAEVSDKEADPPSEVCSGSVEGEDPATEIGEVRAHTAGETQAAGATGETMLVVDDEPAA